MRKRVTKKSSKRHSTSTRRDDTRTPILKWIGAATAVLSLVFGLYQLVQIIGGIRTQQHEVSKLLKLGKDQETGRDYAAAWVSFDKAAKVAEAGGVIAKLIGSPSADQQRTRAAQENLAMVWVDDVHVPKGKTFSDVVDKLIPILIRGTEETTGVQKADLLAHIGWANFLRRRDGAFNFPIEEEYQQALKIDPSNPYAHAMWGHWLIANGNHLKEAEQHFAAALKSGRKRPFVRKLQLAALQWVHDQENLMSLLRVCNDMRKNQEPLSEEERHRMFGEIDLLYKQVSPEKLAQLLPVNEQRATYQWLHDNKNSSNN